MVLPPKISPTIPKRRVEPKKLRRIVPRTYAVGQPAEPGQAPSMLRRLLRFIFKTLSILGLLFLALAILGLIVGLLQQDNQPVKRADETGASSPRVDAPRTGQCTTNADCTSFGLRNCQGSANARCGRDGLCHCCLLFRDSCLGCATGCDANTYCEGGACVFKVGGKVYE